MKKFYFRKAVILLLLTAIMIPGTALSFWEKGKMIAPSNGIIAIPLSDVSDGAAHFYRVKAENGVVVRFFLVKSRDDVIRAAIDACDVCFQAGKGYGQNGDYMICKNCGQRFAMDKINVISGGCNPAPLTRRIEGDMVILSMKDINDNSWYCRYSEK